MRIELWPYESCSFCDDIAGTRKCAFVMENELALVEIDERQYERGAMLIIPRQHRETILDLEDGEVDAVYRLAKQMTRAAVIAFGAIGANVYQNNGHAANQHEPHLHVHVVPRYKDSVPTNVFHQEDYSVTPLDEQRTIAAALRAALER